MKNHSLLFRLIAAFAVITILALASVFAFMSWSTSAEFDRFRERLDNQRASELGMAATKFADPTGLDNNNKSTAADILKLASAAFARTEIKDAVSREEYELSVLNKKIKRKIKTTDRVLGDDFGVVIDHDFVSRFSPPYCVLMR